DRLRPATLGWLLATLISACGAPVGTPISGPSATSSLQTRSSLAVHILTGSDLRSAIDVQRTGGVASLDVVVDLDIDATRRPAPQVRECVPLGQCAVLGILAGFDDPEGTVALAARPYDQTLPPPTSPADLRSPVALRLSGTGPIEFLGHVRTDSTLIW